MNDNLKLYLAVLLKNIVIVITFAALAIVFQRWWMSLFSIIFWSSVSLKTEE